MPTDRITTAKPASEEPRYTYAEWASRASVKWMMRHAAWVAAQNVGMARRIQKHRRIITRLLAERRAAKLAGGNA